MFHLLLMCCGMMALLPGAALGGDMHSRVWSQNEGVTTESVRYTWRFSKSEKPAEFAIYKQTGLTGWTLKFDGKSNDSEPVMLSCAEASEALTNVVMEFAKERKDAEISIVALNMEAIPEMMADISALLKLSLMKMPGKVYPKSQILRQAMQNAMEQVWQKSSLPQVLLGNDYEVVGIDTWDYVPIDLSTIGKSWADLVKLEKLGLTSPQIMVVKLKRKSGGNSDNR